ncbi:MAG TPA: hypothetical protein VIK70_02220 [Lysobacter sp.]
MNVRLIVLSAIVASATLFSMSAKAHDPAQFDRMMEPEAKAVPETCLQLADTHNYSNDVSNADIKALQARCDVATRAAAKKAAAKKAAASTTK